MINRLSLGLISVALAVGTVTAHAQAREEARLLNAQQVLKDLHSSPDQFVPQALLERAYGIAIIPDVTKAAFFLGGARGNGVLVVRDKDGRFTDPIFVNLTAGSFGFQWGIQSTDVVLVFTSQRSIDKITSGKITLGADASIAAGPVGRQASAGTDPTFHSEIYSYSRSRGLFAGIALSGDVLTIDNVADARFYDRGTADASAIASGSIRTQDDIARRFLTAVNTATNSELPASASAAPVSSPKGYSASAPAAAEAPASTGAFAGGSPGAQGATTFPLSDPHPGTEPPR